MTKLRLGVLDIPHGGRLSTGDLAEILEAKYGIMKFFWDQNRAKILAVLEEGIQQSFETYFNGGPLSNNPFPSGEAQIEKMFREFLSTRQMDHKVAGVPTMASLQGKSSRFKSGRGSVRPSFIDTGLYETSFKAKVDF